LSSIADPRKENDPCHSEEVKGARMYNNNHLSENEDNKKFIKVPKTSRV
jgi:hypothetical protein